MTPFDYGAIGIHNVATPTEETVTYPTETYTYVETNDASLIPQGFTDQSEEPGDQTAKGTTTMTPYTLSVTSPAPTSGPLVTNTSQPANNGVSTCEDMDGSSGCGTEEGSTDDALPTPAAGSQSSVMTDETEIGGTEPPTYIPKTQSQETPTQPQTDNFEGSASGEDEVSGQDVYPPEMPKFTSTFPPIYSTLPSQQPQPATGSEVTEVPVVLPDVDMVTETNSGAEELSRQGEVSGGGLVDLPQEVSVTVLTEVAAVTLGEQTTQTTHTKDITSERSTPQYSTRPSFVATDDRKHSAVTTERADMAPEDTPPAAELYTLQTEQSTTTSRPFVSQSTLSTTSDLYSFDSSTHSIPQWALIPDPMAIPLPKDFQNYDSKIAPPLLTLHPQIPEEIPATRQPESSTDLAHSLEASNVTGTRGALLAACCYSGVNITLA